MRKINKAVLKQTIDMGRSPKGETGWKESIGLRLQEKAIGDVVDILKKYIVYADKNDAYWVDRYWYFDVEKYETDLIKFGIDYAKAIRSPINLPEPDEL